jgi:hypothetical protein
MYKLNAIDNKEKSFGTFLCSFSLVFFFLKPCGASVTAVADQVMLNCLEAI